MVKDGSRAHPLRIGIVGCGAVAERYHAPALAQLVARGDVEVTRFLDPDPGRVEALRGRFPGAGAATALADLDGAVDLVIVASPVRFHAEQTIALAGRGIHVLCEKPLARTAAEARAMIAAAERAGVLLAVGLYKRFFPAVEWIGQMARETPLGRVTSFHLEEGGRFAWPAVTPSLFDRAQSGGGVTMDIGVHLLDIVAHWFGPPSSFAYADDAYGGVESNAVVTLRYRDGLAGTVRLSWDVPLSGTYALDLERGWIRWTTNSAHTVAFGMDGVAYGFDARLAETQKSTPRGLGPEGPRYLGAFTAQLLDVVSAIRHGRRPRVDGAAGLAGLELIESLYAAREVLLPPHFTPAEGARALELARGVMR